MKRNDLQALGIMAVASASACSDEPPLCTLELRTAVLVEVSSPEGLPIDAVTAEHELVRECSQSTEPGELPARFDCSEAGEGTYSVRVQSGEHVWTRTVEVREEASGCHVAETEKLSIALTADSAD